MGEDGKKLRKVPKETWCYCKDCHILPCHALSFETFHTKSQFSKWQWCPWHLNVFTGIRKI